jgi:hypothetical protein
MSRFTTETAAAFRWWASASLAPHAAQDDETHSDDEQAADEETDQVPERHDRGLAGRCVVGGVPVRGKREADDGRD